MSPNPLDEILKTLDQANIDNGDMVTNIIKVARSVWNMPESKYSDEAVIFGLMTAVMTDIGYFHTTIPQQVADAGISTVTQKLGALIP